MIRNSLKFAAAAVALSAAVSPAAAQWAPERPVEFVAAAGPGGGTDTFARVVQSALSKKELLSTPIIVSNKAGGSGAETFVYAKTSRRRSLQAVFGTQDAYVLPLASKLSTTDAAGSHPVAAMVFDPFILWVNPKVSGIEDVKGFIAKAKEAPGTLKVGGAKAKEADETLMTLIEQAGGVDLTYIPYKSGSEAAVQVAGGHIDANVNNPSESVEQWKAGVQKPLCVFEEARLADTTVIADGQSWNSSRPAWRPASTSRSFAQPRTCGWPKGVPPEALAFYTDLVKKVAQATSSRPMSSAARRSRRC